jgi:cobalt/nickel transport system ATP-binding protein
MIAIRACHLDYSYPDGTHALKNISFEIMEREKLAIIGPNGSGKSTLLTLFNSVREAQGELYVFNYKLDRKNRKTIKNLVGLVFQNPDDQLFCPTIFEDIAFGPLNLGLNPTEVQEAVGNALKNVGLEGYQDRSSFHLSYGERKLASIATVVAMNPRLISLDEPTSNLDLAHRRKIIQWLQASEKTIVLTTHDLDMALDTCQRVILLNQGQIITDGKAKDILLDQQLLEQNDLELPLSIQNRKSPVL